MMKFSHTFSDRLFCFSAFFRLSISNCPSLPSAQIALSLVSLAFPSFSMYALLSDCRRFFFLDICGIR
eukprot:m.165846 g.165846  ORF g.165846 m.165846 type:complete len:68 (+) comp53127_c0_seq5:212-415(+)